ncbi:MAG TPA: hypothetical protein VJ899_02315, partial [Salegentibacter sp.]|nr:hypothetical protein [Salegentibacter sp.]
HLTDKNIILLCQNRSKQKITISIPEEQEHLLFIDYYYRSPSINEEIQIRFHLEKMKLEGEEPINIGNI